MNARTVRQFTQASLEKNDYQANTARRMTNTWETDKGNMNTEIIDKIPGCLVFILNYYLLKREVTIPGRNHKILFQICLPFMEQNLMFKYNI